MRAHFGLPSVEAEDKEGKPPISVKFEIPYFTTSGIQVSILTAVPLLSSRGSLVAVTGRLGITLTQDGAVVTRVRSGCSR